MICALTIAGSDSGGGAGIQADLKTFETNGVFGLSAITALTAQNTCGVFDVMPIPEIFVIKQLEVLFSDFTIPALKTGMLAHAGLVHAVSEFLILHPRKLVVDPVMLSTSGNRLLAQDAILTLESELLPLAHVITPNTDEAGVLCKMEINTFQDMKIAAKKLHRLYPEATIVIKGGHLSENITSGIVNDLVLIQGKTEVLSASFRPNVTLHGTGCTFSAAITAGLALGMDVLKAVKMAKAYIEMAIQQAPAGLGKGATPLRHRPI